MHYLGTSPRRLRIISPLFERDYFLKRLKFLNGGPESEVKGSFSMPVIVSLILAGKLGLIELFPFNSEGPLYWCIIRSTCHCRKYIELKH